MKLLSVIVPCYNEQENIQDFYDELMKNEAFFKERDVDIELVYVNDGSTDKTVDMVKELNNKDKRVKLVSFSRSYFLTPPHSTLDLLSLIFIQR